MRREPHQPATRHYFVDEAGDGTLFDHRGRVMVGQEGCSQFFMLGFVDIENPGRLREQLQDLRASLMADPYFRGVPSMQPSTGKTAAAFHAKDDLPEVRREVLSLLRQSDGLRFFAVVRDKRRLVEYVRERNDRERSYRYNPNELYDYMVRRLFKTVLHKDDEYHICFARRGNADRMAALRTALEAARLRFTQQWGIESKATLHVTASRPHDTAGLEVADYFLWALQRLYERREDRYLGLLWSSCRLVVDCDDGRKARTGVYYTREKPLDLAAFEGRI